MAVVSNDVSSESIQKFMDTPGKGIYQGCFGFLTILWAILYVKHSGQWGIITYYKKMCDILKMAGRRATLVKMSVSCEGT